MAFYTQGILFCTYISTVQVHIALLKFYMQTALLSHGRKCFRLKHEQEINLFITMLINRQVYFAER